MNILEKFPNATEHQKIQLLKAHKDWENAIIERGDPPYTGGLDGTRKDYYGDFTFEFKEKVDKIMN